MKINRIKLTSIFITISVLTVLIMGGGASAFIIDFDLADLSVFKEEIITIIGKINIQSNEHTDIDSLELSLSSPLQNISCLFRSDGGIISGCEGIEIYFLSNSTYGYGYGYLENYGYGYLENYGYGYTDGVLLYEFVINTSYLDYGIYQSEIKLNIGEQTFSKDGGTLTIHRRTFVFNDYESCLNADISGDYMVDVRDFMLWNQYKFLSCGAEEEECNSADINGDGRVDVRDFMIWNYWKFRDCSTLN